MTIWTLTTEPSGCATHRVSGEADSRSEAAVALVTAARNHLNGALVSARYIFDIDGEVIAVVSSDDGEGLPDRVATLGLLDRIDLPGSLSGTTDLATPPVGEDTEIPFQP